MLETYETVLTPPAQGVRWGKVLDQNKCIGCHACSTACKSEHEVPLGINRTFVKAVEVGSYPDVNRYFQIDRCNQCTDAPCVPVCPVTAMFIRPDGIVDFDREACIGCKACMAACPYDAININPDTHSVEKCNFCAHRIDQGLEPACVVVCPAEAIIVGDLNDPTSEVSQLIARNKAEVRKPEKGTSPKVFYIGAHEVTLNPSVGTYTGMHMWSEQKEDYPVQAENDIPGVKSFKNARVAYEVPHKAPWDWRVSLYTWTKSLAGGSFMMYGLLQLLGAQLDEFWAVMTAVLGGVFLGLTGLILIFDLEKPMRFYRIFTRPQWRSWLVRGANIIMVYALILALLFIGGLLHMSNLVSALVWPGLIFGVLVVIYTAWLFGQSKGRDLWQNPLLPGHLLTQGFLAGSAAFLLIHLVFSLPQQALTMVEVTFWVSLFVHLAFILSEWWMPHMTIDAKRAAHQMVFGAYKNYYWTGLVVGTLIPLLFAFFIPELVWVAAVLSLVGLLAYEHAYVQAGQSVPLT
ncbi:MAG: Fe-S-cluster-containing hydrogenase components 1 [Candidatus Carbobacillus altaicus]|uniref:Fe-S-cluster-containing hydrogenase components 1 n=1 Tax=Candidatus Carbonibacillus altaicus TaxID=2163959 RepID=A0A2R6Y0W7_9BACL|nr:MAG: Fe-S-cluster-containing hydrogenase components 1 [Candidatus Carbobacillus altaicus]